MYKMKINNAEVYASALCWSEVLLYYYAIYSI